MSYEATSYKYVVRELGNGKCDVVHLGPYVVSKDLKLQEALALAAALNSENKAR
jgi:hypothetical protein